VDLELKHLQLVLALAEHHTLTKAGITLHLTQSALSHQLKEIEGRLGCELFVRTARRMYPTPAGERLLETARAVLPQVNSAERALREGMTTRRIPLRLTTECYTCYHWLPAIIASLRTTAPLVDITVDVSATARPLDALMRDEIDLAIVSSPGRYRGIALMPLFDDEMVVVVARKHRLARQKSVAVRELRSETLLMYGPVETSHIAQRILAPAGVSPAAIKPMQLTEAIVEMVKADLGVGILARWAVQPQVTAGTVRALRLGRHGYRRSWRAAVPQRLASADYVKSFVRLAKDIGPPPE
jgi:LysR family transcriptional regulator for metE and metH